MRKKGGEEGRKGGRIQSIASDLIFLFRIHTQVVGGSRCPIVDTWWQTETGNNWNGRAFLHVCMCVLGRAI